MNTENAIKYVLVTRPSQDAESLEPEILSKGYKPLIDPILNIKVQDYTLPEADNISSLIFTSKNAIRTLARADINTLKDVPVFTVGDKTAALAREAGFEDITSAGGKIDDLKMILENAGPFDPDKVILYVSGEYITDDLSDLPLNICRIITYKAALSSALSTHIIDHFKAKNISAVTFFSERSAAHFSDLFADLTVQHNDTVSLANVTAICISDKVTKAVDKLPWKAILTAERPDQNTLLAKLDDI